MSFNYESLLRSAGLLKSIQEDDDNKNCCSKCGIPLTVTGDEQCCPSCGKVKAYSPIITDLSDVASTPVRRTIGAGGYYSSGVEQTASQQQKQVKSDIEELWCAYEEKYKEQPFSQNIISRVATRYNDIQRLVVVDDSGTVKKGIVYRRNVKRQILAALIYYECLSMGDVQSKQKIAKFMNLPKDGFSAGEIILYKLQADGLISLPEVGDQVQALARTYLINLGILEDPHSETISSCALNNDSIMNLTDEVRDNIYHLSVDLVNESNRLRMLPTTQDSSKMAGAISTILRKMSVHIPVTDFEKACGGVRRNTYAKFERLLMCRNDIFAPLFTKNNINYYV